MQEEKKLDKAAVLSDTYTEKDIVLDRQLSVCCHLLGLVTNIFGPLIFVLTKQKDAAFLRHHEIEALNFQFTVLSASIAAVLIDMYFLDNPVAIPVVMIINFYSVMTAVVKTKHDIFFKYPISIRIIPNNATTEIVDKVDE